MTHPNNDRFDFIPRHHDRHPYRFSCPDHLSEITDCTIQNISIKEKERAKRLVLCRCADMLFHVQMGQKLIHFRFGHFPGVPDIVKEDISLNPIAIGLFGPSTVMARTQGFPQLIEEFLFRWGRATGRRAISRSPRKGGPMGGYVFQRCSCPGHSSAPKHFETSGRNLRTDVLLNQELEKLRQ